LQDHWFPKKDFDDWQSRINGHKKDLFLSSTDVFIVFACHGNQKIFEKGFTFGNPYILASRRFYQVDEKYMMCSKKN